MKTCQHVVCIVMCSFFSLILLFTVTPTIGAVQVQAVHQTQSDSIVKMQQRIADIEREIKSAEAERVRELQQEVMGLFSGVDRTYSAMSSNYQRQVTQLNDRMKKIWQKIEGATELEQKQLNQELETLQAEWDQAFERLTSTHDRHLRDLMDSVYKLRGEFSEAASRSQSRLENKALENRKFETSVFEATATDKRRQEFMLKLNRAYANSVGDRVAALQEELARDRNNLDLAKRLEAKKEWYRDVQTRLQGHIKKHVAYLDEELAARESQLKQAVDLEAKAEIAAELQRIYDRKNDLLGETTERREK